MFSLKFSNNFTLFM